MKPFYVAEILFLKRRGAEVPRTQSEAKATANRSRPFLCVSASLRFIFVLHLGSLTAHAAEPALRTEARQALAESIPQVAVQKLKTLLAKPGVPPAERVAAQLELGAAYFAAGKNEEAFAAVQALADSGDAAARLLRAELLARTGRWEEALTLFQELAAKADAPAAAQFGLVESQAALGQSLHGQTVCVGLPVHRLQHGFE